MDISVNIGTYRILRALWQHWITPNHPIYKAESRRMIITPAMKIIWRYVYRIGRPALGVGVVLFAIAAAELLCRGGQRGPLAFSSTIFSLCSVVGIALILIALLLLTYLWPLAVSVAASSTIAGERERQTWDSLLTLPIERTDLLLVKLAVAMRRLNSYSEILLWVQVFLVMTVFVLIVGDFTQRAETNKSSALIMFPMAFLTMIEFGIARLQDYVLSGLVGVAASLQASTRQSAGTIALMLAAGMVVIRGLLTGIVLLSVPLSPSIGLSPPFVAVLVATGPSSVMTIAWTPAIAAVALITMVVLREGAIRVLFGYLVHHMGDAPEASAA